MKWNVFYLPSRRHRKPLKISVDAECAMEAICIGAYELLGYFKKPIVLNAFRAK